MMKGKLYEDIQIELQALSDAGNAKFASALIPDLSRPMLGVRLPMLRSLARRLAKEHGELLLFERWRWETFEEVMLWGMLLGNLKLSWSVRWDEICKFVPLIDNWSVCDSCCATYKEVRMHRGETFPYFLDYLNSPQEFEQRFAVVMMMDHYLVDEYIQPVLDAWRKLQPAGYYAEMAVGWGLSVAALQYPALTLPILTDTSVDLACRAKACQKILESKRTPAALRQQIREIRAALRNENKLKNEK